MEKFQYFNGVKFTRDEKTGYYLNSTIRKRMHRYVWEFYNGPIPKGCCVHHIDHDRSNNNIKNLVLMSYSSHSSMHCNEMVKSKYDEMVQNLNQNARPKACEWHKSEAGREWHKQHYKMVKSAFHNEKAYICEWCGKEFKSEQVRSRFCCNNCKSAFRRKSGADNEERKCAVCGNTFVVNKYSKTKTCSNHCARIYSSLKRKEKAETML